jgi:hypothetical protein
MKHRYFVLVLLVLINIPIRSTAGTTILSNSKDSLDIIVKEKNAVYLELLGNAGLFSLNYDRIIISSRNRKVNISGRIGYGHQYDKHDSLISVRIPLELNLILNYKSDSHFEMGFGYTPFINKPLYHQTLTPDLINNYLLILRAGYRYQAFNYKGEKRIVPFGRAALEGFIYRDFSLNNNWQIRPFISLCLGFTFGNPRKNAWYYE